MLWLLKVGLRGREVLVILEWLWGVGCGPEGDKGMRGCALQVVGEMS